MKMTLWTVWAIFFSIFPLMVYSERVTHPYFVETIQNVSAAIGRDAHLNCSIMGAAAYKVAWIGLDRGTVFSLQDEKVYDHPRVEIRHSSSSAGLESFILTMKDITHEDKGSFLCQVNTPKGLRRIYTLSIVVPPTIKDASSSSDIELSEGESAKLTCKAEGTPDPTITWRREDASLIRLGDHISPPIQGEKLVLNKVDRSTTGAYLCIASNGVPPSVSKRIQLNVRFPPKNRATVMFVEAQIGGDVNLSCVVDAFPKPEAFWVTKTSMRHNLARHSHDDGRLIEGNQFMSTFTRVNDSQFLMTLVIRGVQRGDFQVYGCVSNNSEGVHEARVTLSEIVTTTLLSTTVSTTFVAATKGPRFTTLITFYPTLPKTYMDWKPGIESQVNRTQHSGFSGTTPSPQQSYFSDQSKHTSDKLRKKDQNQHSHNNDDVTRDLNSKTSIFSLAGRNFPSEIHIAIASSILLIVDSRL